MKAIQYTAPRQFAVVDLPKPEPGPHQVVIRVKACGICKTDLTIHDGSFLAKFPLVNGHEFAGVIDSVGSAVTKWKVGDRVTADNTELCGYCEPCRSDKPLYCENFNSHGCNMPGGFAEYVLNNHDKVFALSDKLSFEEATFTEPTACAVHGVDRIAPRFGDSILMFGAGPTGIILAQLLRRAGAGRMVIADPHADKLDILRKYGFTDLVVSAKAHDVMATVATYRQLARELPTCPLHIGVTEAGTLFQGVIKSACGLGILLEEGIGDTLRISLTDDPVEEVRACWTLLAALDLRRRSPELISCPTCGRCQVDLIGLARQVEERIANLDKPLKVAVMGCVVNGPGEAADADIGVACGAGMGVVFSKGDVVRKVEEKAIVDALMEEIGKL